MSVRVSRSLLPLTLLVLSACQASDPVGGSAPASPELPLTTLGASGSAPWMLYAVALDTDSGAVEMTPLDEREGAHTVVGNDVRMIDATGYLRGNPCSDCFQAIAIGLNAQRDIQVDFRLKHPFPNPTTRADLDVFDPIAIFYADGQTAWPALMDIDADGDEIRESAVQGDFDLLVNPDGYTNRHDFAIDQRFPLKDFDATINPFVTFFTEDNPSPTINGQPIPWHRFGMTPNADVQRVVFTRPPPGNPTIEFLVALSVNWGLSATFGNTVEDASAPGSRTNPVYMNPEFNRKEAYEVEVVAGPGLLAGVVTSTATVGVFVKDWQSTATVDPAYPGAPTYPNREGLRFPSDVAELQLSIPPIMPDLLVKAGNAPDAGDGSEGNPYRYDFLLTNTMASAAGVSFGLVAVIDDYEVAGQSLTGLLPTEVHRSFTTWQLVAVTVEEADCSPNDNPTAQLVATPNPVESDQSCLLDASGSFDPDSICGDTLTYVWDFDDRDGVILDPKDPNADLVSTDPLAATTSYTNAGTEPLVLTASLRAWDGFAAFGDAIDVITVLPPLVGCPTVPRSAVQNWTDRNTLKSYLVLETQSNAEIQALIASDQSWDFTNETLFPPTGDSVNFRSGIPSDFPGIDIPGATVIAEGGVALGRGFTEGLDYPSGNPNNLLVMGVVEPTQSAQIAFDDPLIVPFPIGDGSSWSHSADGPIPDGGGLRFFYDDSIEVNVCGRTNTPFENQPAVVVESTARLQVRFIIGPPLVDTTQRDYTWLAEDGLVLARWTELLDEDFNPTGTFTGVMLEAVAIP